jgi:UDP-GlcNAc3NAcA epimerase
MKILTVLGARPQFIKSSVVSAALRSAGLSEVVVHTGQHFDRNMSEVFFAELAMPEPKYNLGIHGGSHGAMTGQMLSAIERVLLEERPDAVLVYGDTNSTLAGALAAAKLHIPIAHVEAGLRSFNMRMPEEVNRILTDRISTWLFTPTEAAQSHLAAEGVNANQIVPVGDVMYDVALHFGSKVSQEGGVLRRMGLSPDAYVLATIHRAENTDDDVRLRAIVEGLCAVARSLPVIWPVHPRTHAVLAGREFLARLASAGVLLAEPLGYLDMVQLERYAAVIATDSGGVQKEAFFHGVPCVTLRDETEWVELVDLGWNRLVSPVNSDSVGLTIQSAIGTRGRPSSCYGGGDASQREAFVGDLHAFK